MEPFISNQLRQQDAKINVSPMFAEPLAEINKILIAWEEHKLTEGEAHGRVNDILHDVMDAKASVMAQTWEEFEGGE